MLAFLQDPITRDSAREEAERELRRSVYDVGGESFAQRVINWIVDKVTEAIDAAVRVTPGGLPSLILLVIVLVALVVFLRLGLGPAGLRDALTDRRRGARSMSAAEYRAEAERYAATGDYREAVRARFRAVIRELEQRAVLDPRPGRTAGEIATEGGAAVPAIGTDLTVAARIFDEAWYGRKTADAAAYQRIGAADDAIRNARLHVVTT